MMVLRIERIIQHFGLSIEEFSQKTGVPLSAVKHILSRRNQMSLTVVYKILATFPEIRTEWLLFGKGEFVHLSKSKPTKLEATKIPSAYQLF